MILQKFVMPRKLEKQRIFAILLQHEFQNK